VRTPTYLLLVGGCRAGVPEATVEVRFKDLTVQGTQVVRPPRDPNQRVLSKLKVGSLCGEWGIGGLGAGGALA